MVPKCSRSVSAGIDVSHGDTSCIDAMDLSAMLQ